MLAEQPRNAHVSISAGAAAAATGFPLRANPPHLSPPTRQPPCKCFNGVSCQYGFQSSTFLPNELPARCPVRTAVLMQRVAGPHLALLGARPGGRGRGPGPIRKAARPSSAPQQGVGVWGWARSRDQAPRAWSCEARGAEGAQPPTGSQRWVGPSPGFPPHSRGGAAPRVSPVRSPFRHLGCLTSPIFTDLWPGPPRLPPDYF